MNVSKKRPNELLSESLAALMKKTGDSGILKSSDISRSHFERLRHSGFLREIMNGWYLITKPTEPDALKAQWDSRFWTFVSLYLAECCKDDYCLSSEDSLFLETGRTSIPQSMTVMMKNGGNRTVSLSFGNTLTLYVDAKNFPREVKKVNNLNVMSVHEALTRVSGSFFKSHSGVAEIAMKSLSDPAPLIRRLLEKGATTIAGRLGGAYRHLGNSLYADRIFSALKSAGYEVIESNPFDTQPLFRETRIRSPHVARIEALWNNYRNTVESVFLKNPLSKNLAGFASVESDIKDKYTEDAYNSLSIEGYLVTPDLIRKIASGLWAPEVSPDDERERSALAAKGYYMAFKAVLETIRNSMAEGSVSDPRTVVKRIRSDHHIWYSELFAPSVQSGILKPEHLSGYRNNNVYLKTSQHVPPRPDAVPVPDLMEKMFDLMESEPDSFIQGILGHFMFGFVHPYMDGNGRIARFMMNAVFASSGYPWTIIRQVHRSLYLQSLERASLDFGDPDRIRPFAEYVLSEMREPFPKMP